MERAVQKATTLVRPCRNRRPERVAAVPVVNLTDVVAMAVMLNQAKAVGKSVRVQAHCVDPLAVREDEYAVLDVLDSRLASAIRAAHWGSTVLCEAGLADGDIEVRIRHAEPAVCGGDSSGVTWVEQTCVWPRD